MCATVHTVVNDNMEANHRLRTLRVYREHLPHPVWTRYEAAKQPEGRKRYNRDRGAPV